MGRNKTRDKNSFLNLGQISRSISNEFRLWGLGKFLHGTISINLILWTTIPIVKPVGACHGRCLHGEIPIILCVVGPTTPNRPPSLASDSTRMRLIFCFFLVLVEEDSCALIHAAPRFFRRFQTLHYNSYWLNKKKLTVQNYLKLMQKIIKLINIIERVFH